MNAVNASVDVFESHLALLQRIFKLFLIYRLRLFLKHNAPLTFYNICYFNNFIFSALADVFYDD
jgi:hypothetical protein